MANDHILALLVEERDKLTAAIEALQGPSTTPVKAASKASLMPAALAIVPAAPAKRKLSAAGRRAIIAATKKRWAAIRAAKAIAAAPAPVEAAPAKDAAFRKKMSERMKAAWAVRKKKAARKTK
jgi:hypothetical protein